MTTTPEQLDAINNPAQRIVVLAGAGSGKTRCMTMRIHRLLVEGVRPDAMCVMTFTRKAATEMRERIVALLGDTDAARETVKDMSLGTIHSICYRIMRAYGDRIGYARASEITVVDPAEADLLLERVCVDLGYASASIKGKKWKTGLSLKAVNKFREDYYTGGSSDWTDKQRAALDTILAEYRMRLREAHVLDFGSLLSESTRLFREHPDVLTLYQDKWTHVFIDEVQDVDAAQHAQLLMLTERANVFMVGDVRQSLYQWRSARPDIVRSLVTREEDPYHLIEIPSCFRCGMEIVVAANKLIRHNNDPLNFDMRCESEKLGQVRTFHGRTESIVAEVNRIRRSAYGWGEIAILARRHSTLRRIAWELSADGIPNRRSRSMNEIAGDADFALFHAILRVMHNPNDHFAFLRVADRLGIDGPTMARIRAEAARNEVAIARAAGTVVGSFASVFVPIGTGAASVETSVSHVRSHTDARWGINVSCHAGFWLEHCPDMTLAEALEWFSTWDADAGDDYESLDAISLMTGHAAKGLEWPVVIIAEANEGALPTATAIREGTVNEERNIAYVMLTRAKDLVSIHYREPEDHGENRQVRPISRFVTEAVEVQGA